MVALCWGRRGPPPHGASGEDGGRPRKARGTGQEDRELVQGSGHSLRGQIENCRGFVSPALAPATVDTRHVGAPGCLLARFPVQTKAGQGAGFGQGAVVCRPLAWRALGTSLLQGSGRGRKEGWSMRGPLLLQPARREPPWSATCVLNALLAKAAGQMMLRMSACLWAQDL